ncbi:hypothetical protein [Micromonospora sp. URMC 103]|uniref:hypothetical protein n=1 Tax=Micromonospora sp. URMC 103 TaxID=3423406 RepID=UPI003F198AA7
MFIGTSVGAGVLGNAAYDALKRALGRRRPKESALPVADEADARLLAGLALRLHLHSLGRIDEAHEAIEAVECFRLTGADWGVLLRGQHFGAYVELGGHPSGDGDVPARVQLRPAPPKAR